MALETPSFARYGNTETIVKTVLGSGRARFTLKGWIFDIAELRGRCTIRVRTHVNNRHMLSCDRTEIAAVLDLCVTALLLDARAPMHDWARNIYG